MTSQYARSPDPPHVQRILPVLGSYELTCCGIATSSSLRESFRPTCAITGVVHEPIHPFVTGLWFSAPPGSSVFQSTSPLFTSSAMTKVRTPGPAFR